MTIVTSRVTTPHGTAAPGVGVRVRMLAVPAPWLADSTGKTLGTSTTWSDQNGWWRLDLQPHTAFELPDSVFIEVVEHANDPARHVTHYAQVPPPDPADPTKPVLLRDILVSRPNGGLGQQPWVPIDRLARLRDVDADSVRNAKPGDALIVLASGLWGAGRLLPLTLHWEPHGDDLMTIDYRVTGFGGGGARVGFGDGSEVLVTTDEIHLHTYAGPGTYILTAADVNSPGFNAKQLVTVKDHLPRAFAFLDGDDDWKILVWVDEPLDDTQYAISWDDGSAIEQHVGQRLERVPPRPRVPHQYTAIGQYDVTITDLSTKRTVVRPIEIGEIGVKVTYDDPDHPRIDAHWMANGAGWEMQRDGFPPAVGIVPASGRVTHLGPTVAPGDYRFEVREVVRGQVRRTSVRRRVQPTAWDWRMDVVLTWRSSSDPQGKQTVTVTPRGARSRCTVEWGDGSAAGVVDPGQTATHLYSLPAPDTGWRLRLTETQIEDPRVWTRVLGEPRRVGTPVLGARGQGAVDLDILGLDQDYNDDWYAISWDTGEPADAVAAIGRWYPATHVYATPGHKVIQVDGPGMEAPIKREVDVVFYPSPTVSIAEARDAQGRVIDPERRTARITVNNTASGGPCTARLGDGSPPRACRETEVFDHQYPQAGGEFWVIVSSDADPTAKGRASVTIPFGAARTLFYEIGPDPANDDGYHVLLKVTAKTPGKDVHVRWDRNSPTWHPVPPSNELPRVYDFDGLYTITVAYTEPGGESWDSNITIPLAAP